ncbi:MAG: alpha/beta hydrolase [Maritimibacter sp.]|nr:alpha/beta hydrolase [Maritimibacter sp.]
MAAWGNGTIEAAGKSLEYACWGPAPADAPTLVLLHEGLGCVALWRDLPARLAEITGFGVLAFSRAGYGQSDPADLPRPQGYMTAEAVEVLPRVLDAFNIERCVLLGHSDGATIAAEYAGRVSDARVRALILIAPHFFTEEMGLAEIAEARKAYVTTELRGKMAKYHRDPDNAFFGWNDAWLNELAGKWNVAEVIDYWRIPCLAIQGADDQYGTLAQIREIETRSYAPVETAIIPGAHHAPHLEKPEETHAAIAEFCARLERIEAAEPVR